MVDEQKLVKYIENEIQGYKDTVSAYPNSGVDFEHGALTALERLKNKIAGGSFD